jgi:hypothetical protein
LSPRDVGMAVVSSRLMETFAVYTAQTDFHVGRILKTLDAISGRRRS